MHKAYGRITWLDNCCINPYTSYYGIPCELMDLDFCPHLITEKELEKRLAKGKKARQQYIEDNNIRSVPNGK
jgi:hypothetical protein